MWTISNFRGRSGRSGICAAWLILPVVLLLISCQPESRVDSAPSVSQAGPESPRPAREICVPRDREPSSKKGLLLSPVELESVVVRKPDQRMLELAGAAFVKSATSPLAIEVCSRRPFEPTARTSWPVIELNGRVLKNSRLLPGSNDKLVAFLPDRSSLRDKNIVTVVWVGNEELTRTGRPLIFKAKDVK